MTDHLVTLSSGRRMGVNTVGDPLAVRVVVLCHPLPGAGNFDPNPTVSRSRDVRILSVDRPGYGGSEPLRDGEPATVQARADDIAEYVTHDPMSEELIGGAGIAVVGWGFGGAVALSLAARHPRLITHAAVVGFSRRIVWRAQDAALPQRVGLPPEPGPPTFAWSTLGVTPEDPALALPGVADRLDHMLAESAVQDTAGIEADKKSAKNLSWSDELGAITAPTTLIYGGEDPLTNTVSGRWLKKLVPGATTVRVPDARALAIVSVWRQILERVAPAEDA